MIIGQALLESERKRKFQIAEMVEKTVIDAIEMCAVKQQDGLALSIKSLVIRSVTRNFSDKGVFANYMQWAAMRAVVHTSMNKAVPEVLFKFNNLIAQIATFVSS